MPRNNSVIEDSKLLLYLPMLLYTGVSLLLVFQGDLWGDETFYLSSIWNICHGKILYRDFSFTQGPVFPYLYASILYFTGVKLIWVRMVSLLFSVSCLWLVYKLALRTWGPRTAFWTVWLYCMNSYFCYYSVIAIPLPLTALLMTGAMYLYLYGNHYRYWTLGGLFVILAIFCRLTLAPAIFIYIYFLYQKEGVSRKFLGALSALILCTFILVSFFWYSAGQNFWFNMVGFHLQSAHDSKEFLLFKWMQLRNFMIYNRVLSVLVVLLAIYCGWKKKFPVISSDKSILWVMGIGMALFQYLPHRTMFYYVYNVLPILLLLTAYGIHWYLEQVHRKFVYQFLLVAVCVVYFPVGGFEWTHFRYYEGKLITDRQYQDEIVDWIKTNTSPGDRIFTFDTIYPIEAGRMIYPRTEMSIFSYYRYGDSRFTRQYHLLNQQDLFEIIDNRQADWILYNNLSFIGWYSTGWDERSYSVVPVEDRIEKNYRLFVTFQETHYPYQNPHLKIYKLNSR